MLTLRSLFPHMRNCRSSPCVREWSRLYGGWCPRRRPADGFSVLLGFCLLMESGWIKVDVTGLKVRNRESTEFLWAADFPRRCQAHFREKMLVRGAASLPPGISSDPPLSSQRVTGAQMQTFMGYRSQVCHPCKLRRETETHPGRGG